MSERTGVGRCSGGVVDVWEEKKKKGLIIYNVGERWTGRSQAAQTKAFIQ